LSNWVLVLLIAGVGAALAGAMQSCAAPADDGRAAHPRVLISTELGDIIAEIHLDKAPITAANHLRYVDAGLFDGATFFRVVTRENSFPNQDVPIEVVQCCQVAPADRFPPIDHETTEATGLKHLDGALSMARIRPGSAAASFSITIGEQPEMDFGGRRNADGEGFAVFGYVVSGMDVVRQIHQQPRDGQTLAPPVRVISIRRL